MGGYDGSPAAMTALGASLKAGGTITDLNISNNDLRAKDIPGFADAIKDNGALASLDISSNKLTRGSMRQNTKGYSESYWGTQDEHYESDMSGIVSLCKALKK